MWVSIHAHTTYIHINTSVHLNHAHKHTHVNVYTKTIHARVIKTGIYKNEEFFENINVIRGNSVAQWLMHFIDHKQAVTNIFDLY